MNEKITNERLEEIIHDPVKSPAYVDLAKTLLFERAEHAKNPGVWDGAHPWQDRAMVKHYSSEDTGRDNISSIHDYTRELPKTRVQLDAEILLDKLSNPRITREDSISSILEYARSIK